MTSGSSAPCGSAERKSAQCWTYVGSAAMNSFAAYSSTVSPVEVVVGPPPKPGRISPPTSCTAGADTALP